MLYLNVKEARGSFVIVMPFIGLFSEARGAGRKMGAQQHLAGHAASRGGRYIHTSFDIKLVFLKLQCSLS